MTDDVYDAKSLCVTTGATPIDAGAAATGDDPKTIAVVEPAGEQRNGRAPLKITGDLTITAAAAQRATLAGFLSHGSEVMLDLSGVHECDAAGLQLIYSLGKSVRQRKEHLQIVAISLEIQELAAALGLQIQELSDFRGASAVDAGSPSRSTTGGL